MHIKGSQSRISKLRCTNFTKSLSFMPYAVPWKSEMEIFMIAAMHQFKVKNSISSYFRSNHNDFMIENCVVLYLLI